MAAAGFSRGKGTICLLTFESAADASSSQIGTHYRLIGRLLARRGWEVHVIFCGTGNGDDPSDPLAGFADEGIVCHRLDRLPAPPGAGLPHFGGDHPTVSLGEHALTALEVLHAEHRFDLIEFPDHHALGMRTVQAKAAGDALLDVPLAVKLYGPSRWQRESRFELRSSPRELKLEFCEQYAFEGADIQLSAAPEMLDYVRDLEWKVRDDATVIDPHSSERAEAVYLGLVRRPAPSPLVRSAEPATVTVAVAHYNHERSLPGALASLAAQTRSPEEVIVVDDGSTSEVARRVFSEQEARYPDWTFVRQENRGPGAARNRALERAKGTYFLPFDSDNIATPRLIERLLEAMERNPSRAATTCHNLGFHDDADIEAGNFAFRYSPTGGPRLLACLENVYGDTCALFRSELLRSVGGFEEHRLSPNEDWETFAKMAIRGLPVEVLPQLLFYYRIDPEGRLQTLSTDPILAFRQRANLIDFLAAVKLAPRERRDLLECLLAFDRRLHASDSRAAELYERFAEYRAWHESEMAGLHSFRRAQLVELHAQLDAEIDAQRSRAEIAEAELASLATIGPRRLLRRAIRASRSRISRSSSWDGDA